MKSSARPVARLAALALVLAPAARADAQHARDAHHAHPTSGAPGATTAAGAAHDLHVRLSELRPAAPGDSARAAQLADAVRRGIARYRDVRAAEEDGYRPIFVGDTSAGAVLHYTHVWRGILEGRRLRPQDPGSLLYEKQRDGSLRLVGAMYTAPDNATPEELDRRVPLSMSRWHLHTNMCLPKPVWSREQWARTHADGRPLFGPESVIATREACDAAGGEFKPSIFGWMVHATVFDGTDPAAVWGARDHGGHHMSPPTSGGGAPAPRH